MGHKAPQGWAVPGNAPGPRETRRLTAEYHAGPRLSVLDGSFLRLDSPRAHMHVGWSAVFATPPDGDRPSVQALRQRAASRLDDIGWCRWKLHTKPLGLAEPRWVQDLDFDLAAHVVAISKPDQAVSYEAFAEMRDGFLSEPLDRSRALWKIALIPRLDDGRVGLIGKVHHALVDGIAALQIVGLIVDVAPTATSDRPPAASSAARETPRRGAPQRLARPAGEALALLRATAAVAACPATAAGTGARGAFRVAQAARQDLLPRAPDSMLNVPTGERRTLVGYHAERSDLRVARNGGGGSLNDIGLAMVAGALRSLVVQRGEAPTAPLKAMVPISMRVVGETGPGNRISMVYVQLPVNLTSPGQRLAFVRAQMQQLKDSGRGVNMQTVYAAGGRVPAPLRSPLVKAMASGRVFNFTISQSPGPRGDVHLLGCELQEVYSVVPIPDGHALAIGMVRYRKALFIGCYADPDALPDVRLLPQLLQEELHALATPPRHRESNDTAHHSSRSNTPPAARSPRLVRAQKDSSR